MTTRGYGTPPVGAAAAAGRVRPHETAARRWSAGRALAAAAAADLVFVVGVVQPYRDETVWEAPGIPFIDVLLTMAVFASVFALPLVCLVVAVRAALGIASMGRASDVVARVLYAAAVAVALAGAALYVSPLSRAAIAYLLD
ncbi:hypothetical protein [Motilibacter deserti]|uniref:Uncharacterized protein n=1 Tax=Motilibacter deserti TaxID=2714956 RepID=A0ABX0GSI5_9ACTN|nr:hypothetical protein [Motilibacter deserti]NHC13056.1 hypothetical protein [Motilibacter deserti]